MWETRSEPAHGHCLKRATHGIRCSSASARGYQTALYYCGRPPSWIGGELPVFVVRPLAPNQEVRIVTVRYEYMHRLCHPSFTVFRCMIWSQFIWAREMRKRGTSSNIDLLDSGNAGDTEGQTPNDDWERTQRQGSRKLINTGEN